MRAYLQFLLRFRWPVLVLIALATGGCVYIITLGHFGTSLEKLFFANSPKFKEYRTQTAEFANDEIVVYAIPAPDLFDPAFLARLETLEKNLAGLPAVKHVDSLMNAQRITGDGEELFVDRYVDLARENPGQAGALKAELMADPFYQGTLIANDGQHTALFLELTAEDRKGEDASRFLEVLYAQADKAGFDRKEVRLGGIQMQLAEVVGQSYKNIFRILPVVVLILVAVTFILFRQLTPVFITMFTSVVAMVWATAFSIVLDREVSIMIAMVPAIMIIVAFSDIIHMFGAYLQELFHGHSKEEAILLSGEDVGRACIYTSATTFVGFASLAFVPTPVFRQMGLVLGFGVAIALVLALTLCPILFSILPKPRLAREFNPDVPHPPDLLDRFITWVSWVGTNRPWLVMVIVGLFTAVVCVGVYRVQIETNFANRLSKSNHIRQADDFLKANFAGTNFLEVYIDSGQPEGIYEPAFLERVKRFQQELRRRHPEIDQVISFETVMERIHHALRPDAPAGSLPDTRSLVAQEMFLFESSGGEQIDRFMNDSRSKLRLSVRINYDDMRRTANLAENIERWAASEIFPPPQSVNATSLVVLVGSWLVEMIQGQINGLGFSLLAITIMMIVAFRSVTVGLVSMIPNLLPLMATAGYLGLTEPSVDSDCMGMLMIAAGIGVDDTIHFLSRFRVEYERGRGPEEGINRTFGFAGRAIIQTTIILCLGFLPFIMSDYYSVRITGTLLPMTLFVALLADLFLVPAMIELGLIRYRKGWW